MDFLPISTLLTQSRPAQTPVAWNGERLITWQQLVQDVDCLVSRLNQTSSIHQNSHQAGQESWALYCDDSYYFAVAFLALAQVGKKIVLPANFQRGTIEELTPYIDGIISDLDQVSAVVTVLSPVTGSYNQSSASSASETSFRELDPYSCDIDVYTSGSTGKPKAIGKTLANFEAEIPVLEHIWGGTLRDAWIAATVSHQHIYGLLFRVLWPLSAGRVFYTRCFDYPEHMLDALLRQGNCVLVASPAHLKRLPDNIDLTQLQEVVQLVFSSGGPLPIEDNFRVQSELKRPIVEVYGSSETGGVGYRALDPEQVDELWTRFSNVQMQCRAEDSALMVQSPSVFTEDWYLMGDRVAMSNSERFKLLGRIDRVAKIEEKRISLSEMESRLASHGWVQNAKIVVLENKRQILAVVAVLTPDGESALHKLGRYEVNKQLRNALLNYFERVTLPRKWRYVEEFPMNAQGKVTHSDLARLFAKDGEVVAKPEAERVAFPEIKDVSQDGDEVTLLLKVPAKLCYFDGHFDQAPILPGVVQIDWAIFFAKQQLAVQGEFQALEAVKFKEMIMPDGQVKLALIYNPERQKLTFKYHLDDVNYSSGRVVLG